MCKLVVRAVVKGVMVAYRSGCGLKGDSDGNDVDGNDDCDFDVSDGIIEAYEQLSMDWLGYSATGKA